MIVLTFAISAAFISADLARGDTSCELHSFVSATCRVEVIVPTQVTRQGSRNMHNVAATVRTCKFQGKEVACDGDAGKWVASQTAWCRVAPTQPPRSASIWGGKTDGSIMSCTRPNFAGIPDQNMTYESWLPDADIPAPPPDPEVLARRAIARMMLRAVDLGTFPLSVADDPDGLGYVGWNVWLWVDDPGPTTWGPISMSVSEAGYTVTATARVSQVVWDMGNGDHVTCAQGTRWSSTLTHNEPSPDCGYQYQQEGEYHVTATSEWEVEWAGIGESGVIPLELSDSTDFRIAEVQVVNVSEQNG